MRTATGLALVAIGAILAFAVTTSPSFLNLQVAGWILILTGVAGLFVPGFLDTTLKQAALLLGV